MQQQANAIVQTLKARGLRVTPQRFAVYANLLSREVEIVTHVSPRLRFLVKAWQCHAST